MPLGSSQTIRVPVAPLANSSRKVARFCAYGKTAQSSSTRPTTQTSVICPTTGQHSLQSTAVGFAKIANGEAVAPYVDRESLIRAAANRCHDMKEACDLHYNNSRAIKQKALGELCKTLLPEERAILKRKASSLVEAHAANLEYQE